MLPDLLLDHPIEMMVLNLCFNVPVAYGAFTLAAMARNRKPATTSMLPHPEFGLLLGAGVLVAVTVLMDRIFVSPYYNLDGNMWAHVLSGNFGMLVVVAAAVGSVFIAHHGVRALATGCAVAVYLVVVEGMPFSAAYAGMDPDQWLALMFTSVSAVLLVTFGSYLLTTPSHTVRVAATISVGWGLKFVSFGVMSAHSPATSLFTESVGVVSPVLVVCLTALLLGSVVTALAEERRLRSSDFRSAMLAESEERLRLLAEVAQEGIVVARNGVIQEANGVFRRMARTDDVIGKRTTDFLPAPGARRSSDTESDAMLMSRDGRRLPVGLQATALGDGRTAYAIRDLSQSLRDEKTIRMLASRDALTGLANRRTFDADLLAAVRLIDAPPFPGRPLLAVAMLDLDRFKAINDTYGHESGDRLLSALSARFGSIVRTEDTLARIGGDEFALVAWVAEAVEADDLCQRLIEEAARPFTIDGLTLDIGCSAGVVTANQLHAEIEACGADREGPAARMRQAADLALYAMKADGRGEVRRFEPEMARAAQAKLQLESDLRQALSRGEIALHYQVQHDVRTNCIVGYEALMRWRHPTLGYVSPAKFIPIAEETGIILELGRWALNRAAGDFAAFPEGMRVSVNVSPVQFERGDIVAEVKAALASSGLAPERLELEVTEQVLISDTENMLAVLEELRDTGVALSLDDFGSGYSSLAYLTRFPFSKIKIDRCFIDRMMSDERSHALVHSILALAASLNLRVTAEGVETHGQLLHLAKGACDEAQGYLLGRPAALEDIRASLGMAMATDVELARRA